MSPTPVQWHAAPFPPYNVLTTTMAQLLSPIQWRTAGGFLGHPCRKLILYIIYPLLTIWAPKMEKRKHFKWRWKMEWAKYWPKMKSGRPKWAPKIEGGKHFKRSCKIAWAKQWPKMKSRPPKMGAQNGGPKPARPTCLPYWYYARTQKRPTKRNIWI